MLFASVVVFVGWALRAGLDVALRPWHTAAVGVLVLRPLLGLERGLLGDEAFEVVEPIGVERPVLDRLAHGAARLLVVLAVTEPAVIHQLEDVGERPLDPRSGVPERQRPDARACR